MQSAFRIWLLLCFLAFAVAVRVAYAVDERALWLLALPLVPALDIAVHALRRASGPSLFTRIMLRAFFRFRRLAWRLFRIRLAHRRRGRQPDGYCPKCGYPIDPGRCPECGSDVAKENLAAQPPMSQAGMVRLGVAVAIAAAILIGGYFTYNWVDWPSRLPLSMLLRLHDWNEPRSTGELMSRVNSGKLSQIEERAICRATLTMTLQTRGPYPRDGRPGAWLLAKSDLPALYAQMWIYVTDMEMLVDGKKQDEKIRDTATVVNTEHLWYLANTLPAGRRTMTIRGNMAVARPFLKNPAASAILSAPFEAVTTIEVEDRDASAVFTAATGPDVEKDIEDNVAIQFTRTVVPGALGFGSTVSCLVVSNQSSRGLPISGRVLARRAGKGEYQFVSNIFTNPGGRDLIPLDKVKDLRRARLVDVRIEPDPRFMVVLHREEQLRYMGHAIERKKLRRDEFFAN